jgi:hypothetical protein
MGSAGNINAPSWGSALPENVQGDQAWDFSTADGRRFTRIKEGKAPRFEKMHVGMS